MKTAMEYRDTPRIQTVLVKVLCFQIRPQSVPSNLVFL